MLDASDPVLRELRQQNRWLRLLVLRAIRADLSAALATDSQRRVYDLSDGVRATREIAAAAGIGAATVSRWWAQWSRQGLMAPSDVHPGRWAHLGTVEEIGLGPSTDQGGDQ
jgi:hypothetical protein